MAADTLGINGSFRRKTKKLYRVGDCVIGLSGNYMDCVQFVNWWPDKDTELKFRIFRSDDSDAPDVAALVVCNGVVEKWTEHLSPTPILEEFFAIGSGAAAAMAAMHMGASACEAVRIASLVDAYTGSEIETIETA